MNTSKNDSADSGDHPRAKARVRPKPLSSNNSTDMSNASTSHLELTSSGSPLPLSFFRVESHAGSWAHGFRREKLKSCLKGRVSQTYSYSQVDLNKAPKGEEFKKQRVRFYLPPSKTSRLTAFVSVWEPDSAIPSTWSLFLVLPMSYELWAGGFR